MFDKSRAGVGKLLNQKSQILQTCSYVKSQIDNSIGDFFKKFYEIYGRAKIRHLDSKEPHVAREPYSADRWTRAGVSKLFGSLAALLRKQLY